MALNLAYRYLKAEGKREKEFEGELLKWGADSIYMLFRVIFNEVQEYASEDEIEYYFLKVLKFMLRNKNRIDIIRGLKKVLEDREITDYILMLDNLYVLMTALDLENIDGIKDLVDERTLSEYRDFAKEWIKKVKTGFKKPSFSLKQLLEDMEYYREAFEEVGIPKELIEKYLKKLAYLLVQATYEHLKVAYWPKRARYILRDEGERGIIERFLDGLTIQDFIAQIRKSDIQREDKAKIIQALKKYGAKTEFYEEEYVPLPKISPTSIEEFLQTMGISETDIINSIKGVIEKLGLLDEDILSIEEAVKELLELELDDFLIKCITVINYCRRQESPQIDFLDEIFSSKEIEITKKILLAYATIFLDLLSELTWELRKNPERAMHNAQEILRNLEQITGESIKIIDEDPVKTILNFTFVRVPKLINNIEVKLDIERLYDKIKFSHIKIKRPASVIEFAMMYLTEQVKEREKLEKLLLITSYLLGECQCSPQLERILTITYKLRDQLSKEFLHKYYMYFTKHNSANIRAKAIKYGYLTTKQKKFIEIGLKDKSMKVINTAKKLRKAKH